MPEGAGGCPVLPCFGHLPELLLLLCVDGSVLSFFLDFLLAILLPLLIILFDLQSGLLFGTIVIFLLIPSLHKPCVIGVAIQIKQAVFQNIVAPSPHVPSLVCTANTVPYSSHQSKAIRTFIVGGVFVEEQWLRGLVNPLGF